jgi:hypothetical protein
MCRIASWVISDQTIAEIRKRRMAKLSYSAIMSLDGYIEDDR